MEEESDILIFDTGGGRNGTTTRREWRVFEYTNHKQRILGYQDNGRVKVYPIVNAVPKPWIRGIYFPLLTMMNYATLLDDTKKHNPQLYLLI